MNYCYYIFFYHAALDVGAFMGSDPNVPPSKLKILMRTDHNACACGKLSPYVF